jgi:hypothetical protein
MRLLLFLILILLTANSRAQGRMEWGFEYRQKVGFLAAHRGVMAHLAQSQALAGELSWFVNPKGKKQWHEAAGFPSFGVTGFFGSVGDNDILGRYVGAYAFMEFPFLKFGPYRFLGKMGSGLGYTGKVFDQETNPKNVAMSTHVNALICLGVKSELVFRRNKVTLGLDMTHFSNGATKVPNLGVNLPYVSLGYARQITTAPKDSIVLPNAVPLRRWLFGITAIGSVKEVYPTDRKKYPVYALSVFARWFSKPKSGLEAAVDVISKQAIMGYKTQIEKSQWDILQLGIYLGYVMPLDRLHFALGMGAYVKDKYQPEDFLYHRVGLRYYFPNGIHTQVVLKSHWARADYVEWGVGYTFNFNKHR